MADYQNTKLKGNDRDENIFSKKYILIGLMQ